MSTFPEIVAELGEHLEELPAYHDLIEICDDHDTDECHTCEGGEAEVSPGLTPAPYVWLGAPSTGAAR